MTDGMQALLFFFPAVSVSPVFSFDTYFIMLRQKRKQQKLD